MSKTTIILQPLSKNEVRDIDGKTIKLPGILPYPFICDEDGNVGRQDFWRGNPKRCIGFAKPGIQEVFIPFADIEENKETIEGCKLEATFVTGDGNILSIDVGCKITIKKEA